MVIDYHVRIVCEEVSPFEYYRTVQTDKIDETLKCPSHPTGSVRDFTIERSETNIPSCEGNVPSNMKIRTNVGSVVVDDDYTVTADPAEKKYIKISVARDNTTEDIEILAFEKTTGNYGNTPSGKTFLFDLKEFSVVAAGTVLVEEQDWI